MSHITFDTWKAGPRRLAAAIALLLLSIAARAAVPGITGPTFDLTAQPGRSSQPDGASVYTWGYGCNPRTVPGFLPSVNPLDGQNCPGMQTPGPTLIVKQGDVVTVTLTNNLPPAAGNTSILFPGFQVCSATLDPNTGACSGTPTGVQGLLAREAQTGKSVTYTFIATTPGTHAYYSGTQGDLQVEMGLYGALIVLPTVSGSVAVPPAATQ